MKLISNLLLMLLLTGSLFAQSKEEAIQIGEELSQKLVQTLGKNLKHHLKTEGIQGAIHFCNNKAIELTSTLDAKNITVKRTSLRYRNSINAPLEDEKAVLLTMTNAQSVLKESPAEYVYYKPLVINQGVCLQCHGDLSDSTKKLIETLYPNDKAQGYKLGDIRGSIVVRIKKTK